MHQMWHMSFYNVKKHCINFDIFSRQNGSFFPRMGTFRSEYVNKGYVYDNNSIKIFNVHYIKLLSRNNYKKNLCE